MSNPIELSRLYFEQLSKMREAIEDRDSPIVTGFNQTLFNTEALRFKAFAHMVESLGIEGLLTDDFLTITRGNGDRYALGQLIYLTEGGDSELFEKAHDAYGNYTQELEEIVESSDDLSGLVVPGVPDLVRSLRGSGKQVLVATDSSAKFVSRIIERAQVDGVPIQDVVGSVLSGSVESRGQLIEQTVGSGVLVIGDNFSDVELAARVGGKALITNPNAISRTRIITNFGKRDDVVIVSSLKEIFM
jgi:phosphoglycolate phosphatase-like HAD superfamily hydrolase